MEERNVSRNNKPLHMHLFTVRPIMDTTLSICDLKVNSHLLTPAALSRVNIYPVSTG